MNEASLRKWHRRLAGGLVIFVVLQTLTGLVLTVEDVFEIHALTAWSSLLHRGGGDLGTAYRTILALGLLGLAVLGLLIAVKIRQRSSKK